MMFIPYIPYNIGSVKFNNNNSDPYKTGQIPQFTLMNSSDPTEFFSSCTSSRLSFTDQEIVELKKKYAIKFDELRVAAKEFKVLENLYYLVDKTFPKAFDNNLKHENSFRRYFLSYKIDIETLIHDVINYEMMECDDQLYAKLLFKYCVKNCTDYVRTNNFIFDYIHGIQENEEKRLLH